MTKILVHWLLSALCLLLVAHYVPGIFVRGLGTALFAAVVIGLVNGTVGALLKIVTFPLTILTFGIFWLLINAVMLKLAAVFVPGWVLLGRSSQSRELRFVVSHPFARKKANGWGTEQYWRNRPGFIPRT